MTESSLLDKAYTLRQEGKFKESYDTLCQAAEVAGDPMGKASVLLAAVTDLLSLENVELAKTQLEAIKGLLVDLDASPTSDQEQRLRLNLGVELQEALIMAGDTVSKDKTEDALAAFDALITKYGSSLDASYLKDIKDTIYAERAFMLTDLGLFEESLPILQELEGSLSENPSVVFYLGYCYWATKNHVLTRKTLEKAISLGLTGNFEFRAHWALGSALCETGDFGFARIELERARALATPSDLAHSQIFQWLEYCYKQLGLTDEAAHYALLSKPKQ